MASAVAVTAAVAAAAAAAAAAVATGESNPTRSLCRLLTRLTGETGDGDTRRNCDRRHRGDTSSVDRQRGSAVPLPVPLRPVGETVEEVVEDAGVRTPYCAGGTPRWTPSSECHGPARPSRHRLLFISDQSDNTSSLTELSQRCSRSYNTTALQFCFATSPLRLNTQAPLLYIATFLCLSQSTSRDPSPTAPP